MCCKIIIYNQTNLRGTSLVLKEKSDFFKEKNSEKCTFWGKMCDF